MHEIELAGLDGSNLLGYMAALGTLRVLTGLSGGDRVRMSWAEKEYWTPVVHHPEARSPEEVVDLLAPRVCGAATINPAWNIGDNLTLLTPEFVSVLKKAAEGSDPRLRDEADFLCAFGSDAFSTGAKGQMSDTEFRTMSGAGHQHFLGTMRELAGCTEPEHLRRTLFEVWDYADLRPSLRWDPADYRPHALRAEDPSGDPIRTMRGANRLAIEALPLFPTVPRLRSLATVGFGGRSEVTWPIWLDPLNLDVVRSLLAVCGHETGERDVLRRRGIAQVFRAQRFTEGKYRNFTPARSLL